MTTLVDVQSVARKSNRRFIFSLVVRTLIHRAERRYGVVIYEFISISLPISKNVFYQRETRGNHLQARTLHGETI